MILQPENPLNMIGPWGTGGAWIAKPRLTGLVRENVIWDPTVANELVGLEVGNFTAATRAEAQPGDIIDGKALLFRPKITSGKVAVRKLNAHDILRRGGLHQEVIYCQTPTAAVDLVVVFEDVAGRNISGGGVLVQAGSSGHFIFRRCDFQLGPNGYPSEFIIKTAPNARLRLTFEDCIGDVQIDTSQGGTIATCIQSVAIIGTHVGTMPNWKAAGVASVQYQPAVPTVPPVPTIDWQARATAAEAELAKVKATLDRERQTANAQRLWGDLMVQRAAGVALQLQETVKERPL